MESLDGLPLLEGFTVTGILAVVTALVRLALNQADKRATEVLAQADKRATEAEERSKTCNVTLATCLGSTAGLTEELRINRDGMRSGQLEILAAIKELHTASKR